ncbi:hypothetical protein B0F90DRAFT_1837430, partial [Multifurca ochricompacta]
VAVKGQEVASHLSERTPPFSYLFRSWIHTFPNKAFHRNCQLSASTTLCMHIAWPGLWSILLLVDHLWSVYVASAHPGSGTSKSNMVAHDSIDILRQSHLENRIRPQDGNTGADVVVVPLFTYLEGSGTRYQVTVRTMILCRKPRSNDFTPSIPYICPREREKSKAWMFCFRWLNLPSADDGEHKICIVQNIRNRRIVEKQATCRS